jgi:predicted PurR-regulated permease PerM
MTEPRTDTPMTSTASAPASTPMRRSPAEQRARREWSRLRARLATTTPATLSRAMLTVVVVAGMVWLAIASWPALLPFLVGGLIAYVIRPVVDGLDRFMPRLLAALLGVLAVIGVLVAIVLIVVPPLVTGIAALLGALPGAAQIEDAVESLEAQVGGPLPPEAHALLVAVGVSAANGVSGLVSGVTQADLPSVAQGIVRTITNIASVVIGLVVLPTWILTVVSRHRVGQRAVDRRLAPWLRTDFWAIVRIVDRAAGAYVRGYVVIAFLVGLFTYLGLTVAERAGVPVYQSKLALAVLAGMLQVIPELGPLLGYVPALLIAFVSPPRAIAYLVVYVASRWVVGTFFGSRLIEARVGVPPAIMVLGVVAISQFGVVWLLVAGPLIAALWDIVRYLHGRLSEPARPAGILPGQPVPRARATVAARPIPAYYRPQVQGVVNADGR